METEVLTLLPDQVPAGQRPRHWDPRSPSSQQSSLFLWSSHSPCEIHLAQSCCQGKAADQEHPPVPRGQPRAHASSRGALHASSSRRASGAVLTHRHGPGLRTAQHLKAGRPSLRMGLLGSLQGDPACGSHTLGFGRARVTPPPLLGKSSSGQGRGKRERGRQSP